MYIFILFQVSFSPPLSPFPFLPPKHQGNAQEVERGGGKWRETGILVLFHLKTASRNGGKIAPVNYIITAASRERTGIQVAIVFGGMLLERESSQPCLLPPFPFIFAQTSPGSAPTFNACSLHVCVSRGLLGAKGAKERKRAKKGFILP